MASVTVCRAASAWACVARVVPDKLVPAPAPADVPPTRLWPPTLTLKAVELPAAELAEEEPTDVPLSSPTVTL